MAFEFNLLWRFWFLIILTSASSLCTLFLFYHFLFDRNLRQSLNNHVMFMLTLINSILQFVDIPFVLHYYRFGDSWQITVGFSQFWTFIDYGCYSAFIILFAWTTIERHILIFHDGWITTKTKRFFLHYFPIIIILLYCFIYYLIVVVIMSCPDMNQQSPVNGVPSPCIYNNAFFVTWDLVGHQMLPTCIITIASIALFLRVVYQRARLQRSIEWRKQRKMIVQVLAITVVFQIFNFPWAFLQFCQVFYVPIDVDGRAFAVAYFCPYYVTSFFPFICSGTLPELTKRLKKLLFWQQKRNSVMPFTVSRNLAPPNQAIHSGT